MVDYQILPRMLRVCANVVQAKRHVETTSSWPTRRIASPGQMVAVFGGFPERVGDRVDP